MPELSNGVSVLKPDLQPFLARLTNRSRLNDAEQEAVLALPTRVKQVNAQRDIVRVDQTVDHVSVVVEGVVARFGQTSEGQRQITALHIAGDAPDLHLVVVPTDNCPLQALSNTTVLLIPHAELRTVAARYPALAEAFWRHCSVDAAITAKWVLNIGRRDAKTRIAHLLCEMAVRCNANESEGEVSFPFPLTQQHLADATGLTSVHINRSLKALSEEGLVRLSSRTAQIPDWEKLVSRAEFDPAYLSIGLNLGDALRIVD
jgi:CRP-like cAMP-binding protein